MSDPGQIVLRAAGLRKAFGEGPARIEVLRGVDFELRAGESVSVRGESGSGKTTLLNLIAGLELPDGGTLEWRGEAVHGLGGAALAARRAALLGMVFQSIHLFPELTVGENVLMARRIAGRVDAAARKRAERLLERVGLVSRWESPPVHLSGGERQRVAVARALMNEPRVILADEPTGNLDEGTGATAMRLMLDVCLEQGAGLVLVTHNREHARKCDRRLWLHLGVLGRDEAAA